MKQHRDTMNTSDRMQQHRDNGCNDAEKQDATSPGQQTKMSEHNSAQTQHTPLQHNSQTDELTPVATTDALASQLPDANVLQLLDALAPQR